MYDCENNFHKTFRQMVKTGKEDDIMLIFI